ncbi:MAG: nuclear transport factor 2 family protein [candidate division NC10 bacterium]|nr:nuclear transport factor 2 family protein [candidate division NC10 bacterium]
MTRYAKLVLVGLAVLLSLDGRAARSEEVREAIESGNRAFIVAFLRGDAQAVADLYTEDAKVIAPGSEVASGRSAIAAFWRTVMGTGVKDLTLDTAEAERCFVELGTGRLTMDMVLSGPHGSAEPELRIPDHTRSIEPDDLLLYSFEIAGPGGHWVEFSRAS